MLRTMIVLALSLGACSESPFTNDWDPDTNPPGAYMASCSECGAQDSVVSCSGCEVVEGPSVDAALMFRTCRTAVVYCRGRLVCDVCPVPAPPPQCTTDGDCAEECGECYECRFGQCACGSPAFSPSCGR